MTAPCTHPKTGSVTSHPNSLAQDAFAVTRVCDLAECIAEATAWVSRYTRGRAFHVPDHIPQVEDGGESNEALVGLADRAVTNESPAGGRGPLSDSPSDEGGWTE